MTVFFISDSHHNHYNIIRYCNRPFASVQEMNDALIQNWKSVVHADDIVYHLGDFSMGNNGLALSILENLPGKKILIRGNHDTKKIRESSAWQAVKDYDEVSINGKFIVLMHYPIVSWNCRNRGSLNLHGHEHGTYFGKENQYDVGVDTNGYTPINFETVMHRIAQKVGKTAYEKI